MPRKFFVGGNFKLNPCSLQEKRALIGALNGADLSAETEVVIAPPTLYVIPTYEAIRKDVTVAAQNCYTEKSGAFTGEVSPAQLGDAGIPWVILGHSERRTIFGESTPLIAQKVLASLSSDLSVILCVGESLAERENDQTDQVVQEQLEAVVQILKGKEELWDKIVIAYEPVWAIGTGKVATPQQAQDTQNAIRKYLERAISPAIAESTRIIYGGSVNAKNCAELAKQPDIDGFLVGGASLKPEFIDIINVTRA